MYQYENCRVTVAINVNWDVNRGKKHVNGVGLEITPPTYIKELDIKTSEQLICISVWLLAHMRREFYDVIDIHSRYWKLLIGSRSPLPIFRSRQKKGKFISKQKPSCHKNLEIKSQGSSSNFFNIWKNSFKVSELIKIHTMK